MGWLWREKKKRRQAGALQNFRRSYQLASLQPVSLYSADRHYICRKTGGTPVPPELPPQLLPNRTRRAGDGAIRRYFSSGAITKATIDITLIRMFIDGPEVSLSGSPTVSPTTVARWASEFLPP